MSNALTRRGVLAAAGLGAMGALTACGSPVAANLLGQAPDDADVSFWNLFTGGDGANMSTMEQAVRRADHLSIEATTLNWGNPYYTKLALAAAGGTPPDVAITHLSRLPLLASAGLLEPYPSTGLRAAGVTEDRFTPAAWKKATLGGTTYAVPLDTHPFVLFYNVELARKAKVLNSAGTALATMRDADDFLDAVRAMRGATGAYGAVMTITSDPSTAWRCFSMVYGGLAGPIVVDEGTRIALDDDAAMRTFRFLQQLTGGGLMPRTITGSGTVTVFSTGKAGFLLDGEWQVPTYQAVKGLKFNVVPFPALLGTKSVAYADSHALVIPHAGGRSKEHSRAAVTLIRGLLDNSATWAKGGHIPAWLPVQRSKEFLDQSPQKNYRQAAFDAIYDPSAWYTGAGSDFQSSIGAVIIDVLSGRTTPRAAVSSMRSALKPFTTSRPPVNIK